MTLPAVPGAIRVGNFKLLEFFEDGRLELYNLREDAGQRHDLAKDKPEHVRDLHARLQAWREEVKARMPTPRAKPSPGNANDKSAVGKGAAKAR